MKRFLIHSVIFLSLVMGSMVFVLFQADGYTDPFYVRFTTPKQHSLIIGTSKAAQGIRPSILEEVLPDHQVFNFAFTVAHSPFGPSYLNGIQRKVAEEANGGVFIITVDAWSIADGNEDPNDPEQFDENYSFLNNLKTVDAHPNIPYLLRYYQNYYAKIFDRDTVAFLHDDGWLEINTRMGEEVVQTRIKNKMSSLEKKTEINQLSETRLDYLYHTIELLQQRGSVYLVRMPVHPELAEVDTSVIPHFEGIVNMVSHQTQTPYLDLYPENGRYQYTDGVHLTRESAEAVSRRIGLWIKTNPNHD
ncbi:MAG: hypothetical protein AAF466_13235 [Bacteroidota bacterium]